MEFTRIVRSGAPTIVADVALGTMGRAGGESVGCRRHALYADVRRVDINPFTEELCQFA